MGFGRRESGDRAEEKLKVFGHLAAGKLRSALSCRVNSPNRRMGLIGDRANYQKRGIGLTVDQANASI
jgi:hypothetical protein